MKKIFLPILIGSFALFTSCDNELDINTDPNNPREINSGLALASAEASLTTVLGGELNNLGGFYAEYHTQAPVASQYLALDQYNLTTDYADRLWTELYAGCLNDLQYVEDQSILNNQTGDALIAASLKAYTFQLLVDLFNDIPYTDALQGVENITPAPTPGEEIYADLLVKIDAAMAAYTANPMESTVGSGDQIYNGDMDAWIKFANTLKLKLYLRMAYTPQANPAAVNALLAEDNFIDSDAKFANFGTSLNQRNPFYEVQEIFLNDQNNVASNSLAQFYVENSDPRLDMVYRPNSSGVQVSIQQGSGDDFTNTSDNYSRPRINPNTPVWLFSLAESNFLQAEALIRYSGGAGAKAKYDEGVLQSFLTYQRDFQDYDKVTEQYTPIISVEEAVSDAQALTAPGGNYEYMPQGGIEETVRQVIIQKWAALAYVDNIESFIETTRTKFPEIVTEGTENYAIGNRIPSKVSVLQGNAILSILYYPDDEVNRNPNLTQHTSLTDKVWWDQKTN
jgi:hypothetical protein